MGRVRGSQQAEEPSMPEEWPKARDSGKASVRCHEVGRAGSGRVTLGVIVGFKPQWGASEGFLLPGARSVL